MSGQERFDVAVLGSANVDLVLPVRTLPRPGETVLAKNQSRNAGGKGLNQAVAAARAGARTAFVGAVGADEPAELLRSVIADAGIDATRLRMSSDSTGLAVVAVGEDGENLIVVAGGANAGLRDLEPADLDVLRSAKVLVLQLEIPLDTVRAGAQAAQDAGGYVILNAAPAQPLPPELLRSVDLLVVNAHEAATLALALDPSVGQPASEPPGAEDCAPVLLDQVPALVVTTGPDGALFARRGEDVQHQPAPVVRGVDTTGAGDTFTGALAAAVARGDALADAVWFAAAAGSLAVEVTGAVPSIPQLPAIRERMRVTSRWDGWPDPGAARPIDLPTAVPLDDGADLSVLDEAKIIAAPQDRGDWPAWRTQLHAWRSSARTRFGYDDSRYSDATNAWAARCWNVAMVWLWDEALYDWENGVFDVDRLVSTYADFGGLDAAVLWHAYPVIGVDDRNQFDYYRDVPGLSELVEALQSRGIRVFLDYNPWDVGTRRPAGTDAVEVAALVTDSGADGVFLDTLKEGDATLRDTLLGLDPAPALEGESRVPTARIGDHLLSWAQWMADSEVPGVLRARWFEQRHMMHHTRRWNTDHTDELQSAWVNGVGVLIWDVVFGNWIGWSERDRATMRAMRRVQLALGDHLVHGDWEPLPEELHEDATSAGVYGASYASDGSTLWTLVNRRAEAYAGPVVTDARDGRWYDLVAGRPIAADAAGVPTQIAARGIGALLHVPAGVQPPSGLDQLLAAAAADPPRTDADVEASIGGPVGAGWAAGEATPGAVRLPAAQTDVDHRRRVRETGGLFGPAYRPGRWKPLPPHLHGVVEGSRSATVREVAVDAAEVSNVDFAAFLDASGYRPQVTNRFLAHWADGRPVPGTEDEPVTFVDLDDARAYAAWRGARLPTDIEWQLAAADPAWRRRTPLVWNWTASEWRDGRTRWVFPKGGSWYAAEGSDWYVEGGVREPDWMLRLLLLGGGLSRSATIGFRCAVDLGPAPADPAAATTIAFTEAGGG